MATLLNGKVDQLAVLMGICCGSWTVINMATSGRNVCHPLGREDRVYVDEANRMTCRLFVCSIFLWKTSVAAYIYIGL